ncbi:MAG: anaerobic sulfite reductase subunit AsrA [Desulfobacterales bacterium]|nr:anaerobic sulfite reductase subunit AsrA [Desulfobacterales bacterium]
MGYSFNISTFNNVLRELSADYIIYAPVKIFNKGVFSDTDLVTYGQIKTLEDIEFEEKSHFSSKEIFFPITQTLFYFTEDAFSLPKISPKKIIIFCRPCDANGIQRLDQIFLKNGDLMDNYYNELRKKVHLFVLECKYSFDTCFCVSMGANKVDRYSAFIRRAGDTVLCDVSVDFEDRFSKYGTYVNMTPVFIESNDIKVDIPEKIPKSIFYHKLWDEYSERCIACGRCNVVCPTCSCFTMQDIFYEDNPYCGERRRVWASCMIDGFTDMAGGNSFRKNKGERMRFRLLHKIHDFKQKFGSNHHMCVGCGRCSDVCPENISFTACIQKLNQAVQSSDQRGLKS